jgi:glycosyltransferase involved in cell wall biosynthesis
VSEPAPPARHRLSVVIPALNEAERIATTVSRIRSDLAKIDYRGGLEIIVVDDGSIDRTAHVAREAGADRVLVHDRNRGKGAAVRDGMLDARGSAIVFTDADLAYSPDHLVVVLEKLEEGSDVVIGSRGHPGSTEDNAPSRVRSVGSRAVNLLTRVVLSETYSDTQCGLKGFRGDVAHRVFSKTRVDGMGFDIEVLFLAERWGLSVTEIPVHVAYSERSSVHVARDGWRLVRDLILIRRWAAQHAYD